MRAWFRRFLQGTVADGLRNVTLSQCSLNLYFQLRFFFCWNRLVYGLYRVVHLSGSPSCVAVPWVILALFGRILRRFIVFHMISRRISGGLSAGFYAGFSGALSAGSSAGFS